MESLALEFRPCRLKIIYDPTILSANRQGGIVTIFVRGFAVVGVVFLFLLRWRPLSSRSIAIPFSLIAFSFLSPTRSGYR